jgi:hypothetical protein
MMKMKHWQPVIFIALALVLLAGYAQTQAATTRDDDDSEWKGLVESRPDGTEIGNWTIGGQTFVADADTDFEYEHGALAVGSCAEVEYNAGTFIATKIQSQEPQECNGDDDDNGDGDGHLALYGFVESFPASLIGDWVIAGNTYTSTINTEFEQEHGDFAVGICVEVEYDPTNNEATKIETKQSHKCDGNGGGGTNGYSETDGIVDSFPASLIGDWVVDGETYTADANTVFEQEDGPFFVGGCVDVKYVSATNLAIEIETQEAEDCDGMDGDGDYPETKYYGLIETIPDGLLGTWTIGGTDFEADADTEFEQEDGAFAVGVCAEVEYVAQNGVNSAKKIETSEPYHCNGGTTYNTAYGAIDSFPIDLYGTWVIAGDQYVADINTQFDQSDGDFAVGVCVKVKYFTDTGVNQAIEIESDDDCTPGGGGGDDDQHSKIYATIDSFPPSPFIGSWGIGGVLYEATGDTEFEQEHGDFAVGVCVEAKYVAGSPALLHEVETEHAYKCEGNGGENGYFTVFGTVEAFPDVVGWAGTWQVSGVSYEADSATQFEQEHGFFAVGAYVKVKYVENAGIFTALEIETRVAPGGGNNNNAGILNDHDSNDDWSDWVIDGVVYKADTVIDVGNGAAAPQVGGRVAFNSYELAGVQYITRINQANQIYLPVLMR